MKTSGFYQRMPKYQELCYNAMVELSISLRAGGGMLRKVGYLPERAVGQGPARHLFSGVDKETYASHTIRFSS
jgi:hypothetical protein